MRTPMFATLAILAIAAPALAQRVPKFDVSAGYSAMADRELDETFHGWVTSVTGHVNNWLGIKGEVERLESALDAVQGEIIRFLHNADERRN